MIFIVLYVSVSHVGFLWFGRGSLLLLLFNKWGKIVHDFARKKSMSYILFKDVFGKWHAVSSKKIIMKSSDPGHPPMTSFAQKDLGRLIEFKINGVSKS